ncbi:hypothetical protein BUE80_DR005806 [Diplocarpon rosae]|nr:hypothetical protein BUE80_DR005806 [Diplocarpon rosae]
MVGGCRTEDDIDSDLLYYKQSILIALLRTQKIKIRIRRRRNDVGTTSYSPGDAQLRDEAIYGLADGVQENSGADNTCVEDTD